ncbi:MAG: molybdopterin-dependent oxidoreductase [bacterium]
MEITRREFLQYLGLTTAGAAMAGLGCDSIWSVPDELYEKVGGAPRLETWKTSVCTLCPGGCGIKVRLIDGIPVRILGNPIHPVNRGSICPMAEAGIEALFNPDRIKAPLKRVGSRGEGQWQSISWEEAMQMVVSRLQALQQKDETHKLAFWSGHVNTLLSDLLSRFMSGFGSPNLFVSESGDISALATYITQGHKKPLSYNFKTIRLLINFGADVLDVGPSPVRFNQLYSELRNRENGQRTKIVHIDSRLSRTAGISDKWVAIKPGTMAALALGIASVLIKDGRYDKNFVQDRCFGFYDWQDDAGNSYRGFKSLVTQEYYPEKVAEITSVSAERIVELAREFGAEGSALALSGGQAHSSNKGLYTAWAVECLNALKGNFANGKPISLQKPPPFAELSKLEPDKVARSGLARPGLTELDDRFCFSGETPVNLPKFISEKQQVPVDVLLLAEANPVFHSTNQGGVVEALHNIPFIVSFSPFVDETTLYADLILPDHTFLEKFDVIDNIPLVEFSHFGMQQPVIEPLYDSRHLGDSILGMAKRLGGTLASALPWPDYKAYLQTRLEGVYKTGAGTVFTERMDEAWLTFLKERGWQLFDYTGFEEFWEVLLEKGGWLDPFPQEPDFDKVFATPSRRFEFYSQVLKHEIESKIRQSDGFESALDSLLQRWQIDARGDLVYLPHYEPPAASKNGARFDLHLLTYHLITNVNGMGSNLPLVQELFGLLTREYWQSWIELNPETAHSYGIHDGDMVKVTSSEGSLLVQAKILPGVMPEVAYIPFGLGHSAYGRYARGIGVNPYEIVVEDYDYLRGAPSLISTKIAIEKVTGKERA